MLESPALAIHPFWKAMEASLNVDGRIVLAIMVSDARSCGGEPESVSVVFREDLRGVGRTETEISGVERTGVALRTGRMTGQPMRPAQSTFHRGSLQHIELPL